MKGKDLEPPTSRPEGNLHCAVCSLLSPPILPQDPVAYQRGWWVHPDCADAHTPPVHFPGTPVEAIPNGATLEPSPSQVIDEIADARKVSELRRKRVGLEAQMRKLDQVMGQMRSLIKELDDLGI